MAERKEEPDLPSTEHEHLNSPVTDPGYWPYLRRAGRLHETITSLDPPPDPMGYVPRLKKRDPGEETGE